MINLTERSQIKELLDSDNLPFEDIKQNMKELNQVNSLLGGHKITLNGIKKILTQSGEQKITICEIGCGGGDNLFAVAQWCKKKKINADFIGIDIKKECIAFAEQQYPGLHFTWITRDYADMEFDVRPGIIFCSLFCHHFTNAALIRMLQWMQDHSSKGFFVNDLHRHPIAYYSIKWITQLFSHSYLVKNDAPVSVARGFKKQEWIILLEKAGIKQYTVEWKWAFRYLVVCKTNE
jgi:2-polyprenyl-3-methyl-5-hydroxy-6-metoxy-1,4-benzoquinol methylase